MRIGALTIVLIIGLVYFIYMTQSTHLYSASIQNQIADAKSHDHLLVLGIISIPRDPTPLSDIVKTIDYVSNMNQKSQLSMYRGNKVSIKITQLEDTSQYDQIYPSRFDKLLYLVNYARIKNVFVWISAMHPRHARQEYQYYLRLLDIKFQNVGLTVATYNQECSQKIDVILKRNGFVRLVKGIFHGDQSDWNRVSQLYRINAIKLILSDHLHDDHNCNTLATHDVDILREMKSAYPKEFPKIELAFFNIAYDYVSQFESEFSNIKIVYVFFGKHRKYLMRHFFDLDLKRICGRRARYWYRQILNR